MEKTGDAGDDQTAEDHPTPEGHKTTETRSETI